MNKHHSLSPYKVQSLTLPINNLKSIPMIKTITEGMNDSYQNNYLDFESLRIDVENSEKLNAYISYFTLKYK